ncbi:MAG: hypothetical protein IJL32_12025 [Oscillospiraceae bacterium]|nr:hypothetical protein [Oscillospiraceae bacterium]
MTDRLKDALDLLYGNAGYPVCAADRSGSILWQSDEQAAALAEKLPKEALALQKNGRSILLPGENSAVCCEISPLAGSEQPLFLLRFVPADPERRLNRAEAEMLLREQTDALHAAGTAILYAADRMNRERDEDGLPADSAMREPFLMIQDSCYALMRQCLCNQELLWYESFTGAAMLSSVDVSGLLRHFFAQAELLTDRYLTAGECEIQPRIYAKTDPERFSFAMTVLLAEMLKEARGQNVLDLTAVRADENISIEAVLRSDPLKRKEPLPVSGRLSREFSAASGAVLLERFCKAFDAKAVCLVADGTVRGTLTLPAAARPEPVFRASREPEEESRLSLYHVLLSELIPAEVLLSADPCFW